MDAPDDDGPPPPSSSSSDSDADRREFGVFRALPTAARAGDGSDCDSADSEYDAAVAYLAGVRLEAAAAPAIVVADRAGVADYVSSKAAGAAAAPVVSTATPHAAAAAAVPLDSDWLRATLDAFGALRRRVLAARDAADPDPLSPEYCAAAARPPPPPLPASPDPATWPPAPPPAPALAAAPQPAIVAALVAVADACGGGGDMETPALPAAAARWAHALAANLERPVPPAAAAALARLAAAAGADAVGAGGDDAPRRARAAVVAAVAGGWFGQCASLAPAARAD